MFANKKNTSKGSGSGSGTGAGSGGHKIKNVAASHASVALSELSTSDAEALTSSAVDDNGGGHQRLSRQEEGDASDVAEEQEVEEQQALLLNRGDDEVPTNHEDDDDDDDDDSDSQQERQSNATSANQSFATTATSRPSTFHTYNPFRWLLTFLQCITNTEEDEQDPFSKRRLFFIVSIALLSIALNLVVIPLVLTRLERSREGRIQPTHAPTQAPTNVTMSPTLTMPPRPPNVPVQIPGGAVAIALPPYTLQALHNDPNSPQAKAFLWLANDPNLATYSSFRTLQRMALATIFYATNQENMPIQQARQGQRQPSAEEVPGGLDPEVFANLFNGNNSPVQWTTATNWLSYSIHECFWYSGAPFVCDNQQYYRYLNLPDNRLVGTLPPELGLLTRLEQIQLSSNPELAGTIPTHIGYLTQLQALQLAHLPHLTGTLPYDTLIHLHASLTRIHVQETPRFSKYLATDMGRMTRLQELRLETLRLRTMEPMTMEQATTTLPTELGNLRSLVNFTISGQQVVGTLPTQLGDSWRNLQWLQIAHTQVSGTLPWEFGNLISLTNLELSHGRLAGRLPKELSNLRHTLQSLSVNDQAFTGTIPYQFSNLTQCKTQSYQHNQLSGTVPLGMCYLHDSGILHTLRVDCGKVQCSCACECF